MVKWKKHFAHTQEKTMTNKIDREDMLALTRRMNVARSSFTRIAGCYVDKDGDFDLSLIHISEPTRP